MDGQFCNITDPDRCSLKKKQQQQHAACNKQAACFQQQALCARLTTCIMLRAQQLAAASIDWEDWITARLKRAAAARRASSSGGGNLAAQQQQQQPGALPPLARHGNISLRTPSKAQQPAGVCCISSSRRSSVADAGRQAPDWQVGFEPQKLPDGLASNMCGCLLHTSSPFAVVQAQDVTNSTQLPHTTQPQPPQPSLGRLHDRTSSSGSGTQQQVSPEAQPSQADMPAACCHHTCTAGPLARADCRLLPLAHRLSVRALPCAGASCGARPLRSACASLWAPAPLGGSSQAGNGTASQQGGGDHARSSRPGAAAGSSSGGCKAAARLGPV